MNENPLAGLSLEQLRTRTSMKWRTHPDYVLPLWVAEMDVALAPAVRQALERAIVNGDTGYPAGRDYAEAFGDFARERWGWHGFVPENSAVVPDVMLGIVEALRLISRTGDTVIVTPPVYAPFYAFASHAGRHIAEAPLTAQGRLDPDALERAFLDARSRSEHPVLLLSNPHNPTGTVHTRAELETLARLAQANGVRVISDEIHAPLVLGGATFTPYLTVDGSADAFALASASKGWNLAGAKAALLIAGSDAVDDLAALPEEVGHAPSHLGVIAHTAAFRDGGEWLNALLQGLEENRTLLSRLVAEHLPGISLRPPESTYMGWLNCRALNLGSSEPAGGELPTVSDMSGPARFFLESAAVALSSGHVFGTGGDGHARINFATSPEILTLAVERMGGALAARAPSK